MPLTLWIMLVRVAGLAALVLGAAYWAGLAVPLHVHMALGGLVVVGLWGLAWTARRHCPPGAVVALLWGVLLPMLGMAQLVATVATGWVMAAHVVAGVAAIGGAEWLRRIVRNADPAPGVRPCGPLAGND